MAEGPLDLTSCWPATSFRVQTVEDQGINSLRSGRFQNLPKFQCPWNMDRGKSGNLLPYKNTESGLNEGSCLEEDLLGLRTLDLHRSLK